MAISCNKTAWGKCCISIGHWMGICSFSFSLHLLTPSTSLHDMCTQHFLSAFFWVTLTEWDNCSFGIHARAHVNRETVSFYLLLLVDLLKFIKYTEDMVLDLQTKHSQLMKVKCKVLRGHAKRKEESISSVMLK